MDDLPGVGLVVAGVALVVLHIAVALDPVGQGRTLELGEDHLVGLAHDVGEHAQPAAVRHAQDHLFDADPGRALDERVEHRDQGLAALEREAFLSGELDVQELLETLRLDEFGEDALAIGGREGRCVARGLHALLEPGALLGVADPGVLDTHRPAVGLAQRGDEFGERRRLLRAESAEAAGVAGHPQIARIERVVGDVEQRVLGRRVGEGVDVGEDVAQVAIRGDESERGRPVLSGRGFGDGGCRCALRHGPDAAVGGRQAEFEALEEGAPRRFDRLRVGLEATVEFVDQVGVVAVHIVGGRHGGSSCVAAGTVRRVADGTRPSHASRGAPESSRFRAEA